MRGNRGEVPAGVVFATDARISARVREAAMLPAESHDAIRYPIAVVSDSRAPNLAADFVNYVTGPDGQAILAAHGFEPPEDESP